MHAIALADGAKGTDIGLFFICTKNLDGVIAKKTLPGIEAYLIENSKPGSEKIDVLKYWVDRAHRRSYADTVTLGEATKTSAHAISYRADTDLLPDLSPNVFNT